jgi:hypothetical protein
MLSLKNCDSISSFSEASPDAASNLTTLSRELGTYRSSKPKFEGRQYPPVITLRLNNSNIQQNVTVKYRRNKISSNFCWITFYTDFHRFMLEEKVIYQKFLKYFLIFLNFLSSIKSYFVRSITCNYNQCLLCNQPVWALEVACKADTDSCHEKVDFRFDRKRISQNQIVARHLLSQLKLAKTIYD